MKKNILKKSMLSAAATLVVVLSGCSGSSSGTASGTASTTAVATEESKEATVESQSLDDTASSDYGNLKYLRMCSGTQGATWTTVGSAMMEFVNSSMPISASNGPGGSVANCRSVAAGESELGWAFTSTVYEAYTGSGAFSEDAPMENLTHVMSIFPSQQHFVVTADSDIQSLADLNGRIVNYNPVTETCYTVTTKVLETYGINQETIESAGGTVTLTRFNEASELMKDGQLDLWTATIAAPGSTVSELAFSPGIRFINIDEDKIPTILESLPGFTEMTIPAGTYSGVDEDVRTVGTVGSIFTNTDVPEDVIYDFLKIQYEHWEDLKAINPTAFGELTIENWLDGADNVPLHPGAQRFYEEMGILN